MGRNRFAVPEMEVPARVEVRHHEGAVVCSVEQSLFGEQENLHRLIPDMILDLSRWTQAQGGLVGHIKAAVQTQDGTVIYSCTGDEIHMHTFADPGAKLTFAAIVFFVDENRLKQKMEQFVDSVQ